MDPTDIADRLRGAVSTVADELPAHDIASISVLVDAGEWAIALETLCTQIYEYDVPLDSAQRALLVDLGGVLGVQASYLLGHPWAPGEEGGNGSCED